MTAKILTPKDVAENRAAKEAGHPVMQCTSRDALVDAVVEAARGESEWALDRALAALDAWDAEHGEGNGE